jgi:hypothetical protein
MWRRLEPVLDGETVAGIIRKLMSIDDSSSAWSTSCWRTMKKRKRTPGEREAFRVQRAEWEQERRDFERLAVRFHARWHAELERRERRRRLLRRLLPFRRAA